jgi:hypothetical protein
MKIKRDVLIIVAVVYLMLCGLHCRYWKLAMSALLGILICRIFKNNMYGLIGFGATYFLLFKYSTRIEGFEDGEDEENEEENLKDFDETDVNDSEPLNDDDEPHKETKDGKKKSPVQAQKETFQLVNALKELNRSIEQMEPTLKEGAKVLKMMEKFNL